MFELLHLLIALVGTSLASWQDLKKGEVRNLIPATMIASAFLLHSAEFFLSGSPANLISAAINFIITLIVGFILLKFNAVGGADIFIFAGVTTLMPMNPLSYLLRVVVVGFLFYGYSKLFWPENNEVDGTFRFIPAFLLGILVSLII